MNKMLCYVVVCAGLFFSLGGKQLSASDTSVPSLHVLIATIGRESLLRMLQSLQPQLETQDYLTIVFDARDDNNVYLVVEECLKEFRCSCTLFMEPVNRGFWGHGIRQAHNELKGDFILHADDDDIYTKNALDIVRQHCTDDNTLYIFKMQYANGQILWQTPVIAYSHIGTPMGAVPSRCNSQGGWAQAFGGDFNFYQSVESCVSKVEFVDQVIYLVRPDS